MLSRAKNDNATEVGNTGTKNGERRPDQPAQYSSMFVCLVKDVSVLFQAYGIWKPPKYCEQR